MLKKIISLLKTTLSEDKEVKEVEIGEISGKKIDVEPTFTAKNSSGEVIATGTFEDVLRGMGLVRSDTAEEKEEDERKKMREFGATRGRL